MGIPSLRLRGDYLAIVTLGFGEIIRVLFENSQDIHPSLEFMGGATGFNNIPRIASYLYVYGAMALVVYFYAHYGFASITAHTVAMYPAFCAVMLAKGVPPGLAAFSLACFGNLCAALTNYGTTPAPMFFAQAYVPMGTWWRIGFLMSLLTVTIWGTVGFAWWKFLGIW